MPTLSLLGTLDEPAVDHRLSTETPMTSTASSRQWHLANRPTGTPTSADVRFVTVELPPLAENEVRVQNEFISVDPYMRGRMNDVKSYVPPFQLDRVMDADAVGRVIESRSPDLAVGQLVQHFQGWRDVAQGDASRFTARDEVPGIAPSVYLSALGLTGLTAWVGLLVIAEMKPGDIVFVSGAAGAVGSAVGQLARLRGASRVIGSAGTDAKVAALTSRYGFDAAFNYRGGKVSRMLHEAAPDGIDVYFDNVGGDHLEAALSSFKQHGRAAICGMIQRYNDTDSVPGPRNLALVIGKRLMIKGFIQSDHLDLRDQFEAEVGAWVKEGKVQWRETVVEGIEEAVHGFQALLSGGNTGKMLVRL